MTAVTGRVGTASSTQAAYVPLDRDRVLRLSAVTLQLVLLILVVRQFHLESRTFYQVLLLAAAGFPVHALLPNRMKWAFFGLLSLASVAVAFGFGAGAWLIGLVALVVGLCHLPIRIGVRIALVLAVGAVLATLRAGWLPHLVPAAIWPILGAMLMFRTAIYLYTLRNNDAPFSFWQATAYFLMLPNVCFPLFPVVDYKTFVRSHLDGEESFIHQAGIRMAARGLFQLLLYRYVYYHVTLDSHDLTDLGDLLQYILSTFLLYLRVSGQFHLICGLLHLYGFRLPETHHLYFLASSFTDLWRRINIYWKDFMMKLVYYPSFFRLRRYGNTRALVVSTLIVFAATWLLHSYQWFWLRGTFPLTWPDALFWAILALLVTASTLREAKGGRTRAQRDRRWSASLALRTVTTFSVLAILWSLWSAESVTDWLELWPLARNVQRSDVLIALGVLVIAFVIAGKAWGARELNQTKPSLVPLGTFLRTAGLQSTALGALLLIGFPQVQRTLGPELAARVHSVQEARLNSRDAALQQRGYYENLDNINRFNTQLWEVYAQQPRLETMGSTEANHPRKDFLLWDLKPDTKMVFRGTTFTTNRWGMRDRDYTEQKPAGTFRIAVMGPSDVMGWGVNDGEGFESVLEDRLNTEASPGSPKVEVINFAIHAYGFAQQVALLEDRVWRFQPDLVLVGGHSAGEVDPLCTHLAKAYIAKVPIPYDVPRQVLEQAHLKSTMGEPQIIRRIKPGCDSVLAWSVRELGAAIQRHNARPVMVGLRLTLASDSVSPLWDQARAAGFAVIRTPALADEYRVGEGDIHPNAAGHRLIANALFEALQNSELLKPRSKDSANLNRVGAR